jgi:hypothetical protein
LLEERPHFPGEFRFEQLWREAAERVCPTPCRFE